MLKQLFRLLAGFNRIIGIVLVFIFSSTIFFPVKARSYFDEFPLIPRNKKLVSKNSYIFDAELKHILQNYLNKLTVYKFDEKREKVNKIADILPVLLNELYREIFILIPYTLPKDSKLVRTYIIKTIKHATLVPEHLILSILTGKLSLNEIKLKLLNLVNVDEIYKRVINARKYKVLTKLNLKQIKEIERSVLKKEIKLYIIKRRLAYLKYKPKLSKDRFYRFVKEFNYYYEIFRALFGGETLIVSDKDFENIAKIASDLRNSFEYRFELVNSDLKYFKKTVYKYTILKEIFLNYLSNLKILKRKFDLKKSDIVSEINRKISSLKSKLSMAVNPVKRIEILSRINNCNEKLEKLKVIELKFESLHQAGSKNLKNINKIIDIGAKTVVHLKAKLKNLNNKAKAMLKFVREQLVLRAKAKRRFLSILPEYLKMREKLKELFLNPEFYTEERATYYRNVCMSYLEKMHNAQKDFLKLTLKVKNFFKDSPDKLKLLNEVSTSCLLIKYLAISPSYLLNSLYIFNLLEEIIKPDIDDIVKKKILNAPVDYKKEKVRLELWYSKATHIDVILKKKKEKELLKKKKLEEYNEDVSIRFKNILDYFDNTLKKPELFRTNKIQKECFKRYNQAVKIMQNQEILFNVNKELFSRIKEKFNILKKLMHLKAGPARLKEVSIGNKHTYIPRGKIVVFSDELSKGRLELFIKIAPGKYSIGEVYVSLDGGKSFRKTAYYHKHTYYFAFVPEPYKTYRVKFKIFDMLGSHIEFKYDMLELLYNPNTIRDAIKEEIYSLITDFDSEDIDVFMEHFSENYIDDIEDLRDKVEDLFNKYEDIVLKIRDIDIESWHPKIRVKLKWNRKLSFNGKDIISSGIAILKMVMEKGKFKIIAIKQDSFI